MKDSEEVKLITSIKVRLISVMVGLTVTCICSLVVFYFNTGHVLAQNVKDTSAISIEVKELHKKVDELEVIPKLNSQRIENIEGDVVELKEGQKEIRKMNQKILELLYQIKQKQNN